MAEEQKVKLYTRVKLYSRLKKTASPRAGLEGHVNPFAFGNFAEKRYLTPDELLVLVWPKRSQTSRNADCKSSARLDFVPDV